MTCQACGTDQVSHEAELATARLDRLDEPMQDVIRENFDGAIPVVLCANCFLAHYDHAIKVGLQQDQRAA